MTVEETLVLNLLRESAAKITQLDISKSHQWLGSHPVHEAHLDINHEQSTLRRIRGIIRDLRLKYGKIILSDVNGYWIPKPGDDEEKVREQALEYLNRIEKMARAQAKAWRDTYLAMKKNFNVTSEYFEAIEQTNGQTKLF